MSIGGYSFLSPKLYFGQFAKLQLRILKIFVIFGKPLRLLTLQVLEDQTNQIEAKIECVFQQLKSFNENKQELIDHMTEKLKSLKIEKENHEKVKVKILVEMKQPFTFVYDKVSKNKY